MARTGYPLSTTPTAVAENYGLPHAIMGAGNIRVPQDIEDRPIALEEEMFRLAALVFIASAVSITPGALAQTNGGWQRYLDRAYGFSAALPLGAFEVVEAEGTPGMALREIGGQATVNLYGGPAQGMTRESLEDRLETDAQLSTTTYRAGGDSWFVLSGFYGGQRKDTIFYTKVLFSPDHQTFSVFEITFPARDKPRFEALVEHFEDNFTRPRL